MGIDLARKNQAIMMRQTGMSIKSIARELNSAQSSVSTWVRDVKLSKSQIQKLKGNTHSPATVEKRRQTRLENERIRRQAVIDYSTQEINSISRRELFLIGVSLYWAEGGKTKRLVRFSNGDPKMIKLMLRFFREICLVDESKLRGHIHIHNNLNVAVAEKYWQNITMINAEQFFKTYNKPNKSSKGTRNTLPYGVCDVYVLDSNLFLRIQGWIVGIYTKSEQTSLS